MEALGGCEKHSVRKPWERKQIGKCYRVRGGKVRSGENESRQPFENVLVRTRARRTLRMIARE